MKAVCLVASLFIITAIAAQDVNNTSSALFSDNFSTNSNQWPVTSDAIVSYKLWNGRYLIENSNSQVTIVAKPVKDVPADYTLSAGCTHVSGIDDNNFGLFFGSLDNANGYVFGISKNGSYTVFRYINNQPDVLIKWTKNGSIKKEEGSTNILKIKASGNNFEFYINDLYINSLSGFSAYGSRIGFIVTKNQRVEFDDLLLTSTGDAMQKTLETLYNSNKSFELQDLLLPGEKEILRDKFTSAEGWVFDKNEFAISDGKLYSKSVAGKVYTAGKIVAVDSKKDYAITVFAQHYSGLNNYGYGLQVGDNYHNLQFRISKNGLYTIATEKEKLVSWTASTYINQTDLSDNKIQVERSGTNIKFSLNDHLLYTYASAPELSPFWVQPLVDEAQTINFTALIVRGSSPSSNIVSNQINNDRKKDLEEVPVDKEAVKKRMTMVLFDAFSSGSSTRWMYDSLHTKIQFGKLTTHASKGIANIASHYPALETTADFEVMAETKHTSGIDGYGYGLRLGTTDHALLFEITGNGYFQVYDSTKAVVKWTKNAAIKTGSGDVNKLMVRKHATYVEFFCNNVLVYRYDAVPDFPKFYVMLSVSEEQSVEFDNIEINGTDAEPIDWG